MIRFSRHDRLVLRMLARGMTPKEIAAAQEITENTVHEHIRGLCARAQVLSYPQLVIFVMQQPHALTPGHRARPGLHPPGVDGCPYCAAMAHGSEIPVA